MWDALSDERTGLSFAIVVSVFVAAEMCCGADHKRHRSSDAIPLLLSCLLLLERVYRALAQKRP
jgi:hypothetical protein